MRCPITRPDEPLVDLFPRLAGCADGRAVVVDGNERVQAVVSPRDISRVAALAELRAGRPFAPHAELPPRASGSS